MNNKGQVLVAFLLIIPLFAVVFVFLIDSSNKQVQKNNHSNEIKQAIRYYFKNDPVDSTINEIEENLTGHNIFFDYSKDKITIMGDYTITSIFFKDETVSIIFTGEMNGDLLEIRKGV